MVSFFVDALMDAVVDTLKLIPFLFVVYVLMEAMERRTSERTVARLSRVGRWGPAAGAVFGMLPQCGFSAAASSLYAGGVISVGTLLAVFLSTSDEMLPLFLSEHVPAGTIVRVLGAKVVLGLVSGFVVDALMRATHHLGTERHIHDLCEDEHCGCDDETAAADEGHLLLAALRHTLHITVFVFLITLALTLLVGGIGEAQFAAFLGHRPVFTVLLAGLIGLVPNCAASIVITQLYLQNLIGAGPMMAGLLVGAGVGLLVLFRTNRRHLADNLKITAALYVIGVAWGLAIEALGVVF